MGRPELSFHVDHEVDHVRLRIAGDIDIATAESLVEQATSLLAASPPALVLDFSGVTFCASAGVGALVAIYNRCLPIGCKLRLTAVNAHIRHVLQISGVDRVLTVDDVPASDT